MDTPTVLFLGKTEDSGCARALELVQTVFPDSHYYLGKRGDPLPAQALTWQGDYLLSYLSPWIMPESLLKQASRGAINFHPGPPEYPGIGCTNFALYNGETRYGVTCHHMAARVDSGPIIAVRTFPLYPRDTVWTLTQRCYAYLLPLFHDMVAALASDQPLPKSDRHWTRSPYKRTELDALCRITPDMPENEVARRVRAVTFPGAPGAYVEIAGFKFSFSPEANAGGSAT